MGGQAALLQPRIPLLQSINGMASAFVCGFVAMGCLAKMCIDVGMPDMSSVRKRSIMSLGYVSLLRESSMVQALWSFRRKYDFLAEYLGGQVRGSLTGLGVLKLSGL